MSSLWHLVYYEALTPGPSWLQLTTALKLTVALNSICLVSLTPASIWRASAQIFPTPLLATLHCSVKSAMVEAFTPQELVNTTNQGCLGFVCLFESQLLTIHCHSGCSNLIVPQVQVPQGRNSTFKSNKIHPVWIFWFHLHPWAKYQGEKESDALSSILELGQRSTHARVCGVIPTWKSGVVTEGRMPTRETPKYNHYTYKAVAFT